MNRISGNQKVLLFKIILLRDKNNWLQTEPYLTWANEIVYLLKHINKSLMNCE